MRRRHFAQAKKSAHKDARLTLEDVALLNLIFSDFRFTLVINPAQLQ